MDGGSGAAPPLVPPREHRMRSPQDFITASRQREKEQTAKLAEMRKRNMYAVLYLNNNWIWSGGMSAYLNWNGYGEVANPFLEKYTWPDYFKYTQQFHTCTPCRQAFLNHIRFILGRTNSINGKKYTEDNTIMSWQVANEPRIFTEEDRAPFKEWLDEVVTLLENLDPDTLISTGAEGKASYLQEIDTYKMLHKNPFLIIKIIA